MRVLLILLIAALLGLQYAYWWGRGGRGELSQIQSEIERQQSEIKQLRDRNATLAAEVADLKQGLDAVEELARSEMGMVKADEEFYQVVEPRDKGVSAAEPRAE